MKESRKDRRRKRVRRLIVALSMYAYEFKDPKEIARLVGKSESWVQKILRRSCF